MQFSEGKSAAEGSTIVYIDGAFDVFHAGHVEILRVSNQIMWGLSEAQLAQATLCDLAAAAAGVQTSCVPP